jgi:hypothetical protein
VKRLRVNTKDATHDELARLARSCGFVIFSGKRHDKVKTMDDRFITLIPRHNKIKRELAKSIVEAFVAFDADVTFN